MHLYLLPSHVKYAVITQQISIWCEQHGACMKSNIAFHWNEDLTLLLYKEKQKSRSFSCSLLKKDGRVTV